MIFILKNYFIFILNIDGKPSSPEYGDIGGSSQQKTNYHGPWSSKVLGFYFGFVFVFFWGCVIRSYSEKLGNGQNNIVSQEFLPSPWHVLWIILYFPDFDLKGGGSLVSFTEDEEQDATMTRSWNKLYTERLREEEGGERCKDFGEPLSPLYKIYAVVKL